MLTVEESETLTRVGPGTPMGGLQRRMLRIEFSVKRNKSHFRDGLAVAGAAGD